MEYFIIEKDFILDERIHSFFFGATFDSNYEKLVIHTYEFGTGGKSFKDIYLEPLTLVVNELESNYGILNDVVFTSSQLGIIHLFQEQLVEEILKICNDQVEFLQVHIKGRKIDRKDFYAMNALNRIDCAEREQSTYDEDEDFEDEFFLDFKNLVLDQSKLNSDLKIFNVERSYPQFPPIVNEEIRKIFQKRKVEGIKFTPIEIYPSK